MTSSSHIRNNLINLIEHLPGRSKLNIQNDITNEDDITILFNMINCRNLLRPMVINISLYLLKSIQANPSILKPIEEVKILDELILAIRWDYDNKRGEAISKLAYYIIKDLLIANESIATPKRLIYFNRNFKFLGFKLIRIDESTISNSPTVH